jgi:peptidyl-prolyl cis-trans isomerase A (cyclophilin A)
LIPTITGVLTDTENNMRVPVMRTICASILAIGAAVTLVAQGAVTPDLKDPSTLAEDCPEKYAVRFDTSKGGFTIEVERAWAPRGAIRFYNLVKAGYYNDNRFFRVLPGFMAQFGVNPDPTINAVLRGARIIDDVRKQSNERGYVSFAAGGVNTRSTQVFVNIKDNIPLDQAGMTPFGHVTSGMNVFEELYSGYGDGPPNGKGPEQSKIQLEGNAYLLKQFPKLDYIKTATLVEPGAKK